MPTVAAPGRGPRVSVVVPAFNAERTLGDTLRSIRGQTETGIEVVVVDDGSRDATGAVADAAARRDPRVRVVRQGNAGPAAARNLGASLTTAPYVCFFDADDLMPPGKVRAQAALLDARPDIGVVYSSVEQFEVRDGASFPLGPRGDPPAPLERSLLHGGSPCIPSSAMQRRTVFDAVRGFKDGFRVTEDWDFYLRAALLGVRFHHQPRPRILYRRHEDQRSSDECGYYDDCIEVLSHVAAALRRRGTSLPEMLRLRLHWVTLMRAGVLDARGRRARARGLVLRSLRWGHRPGNLLEVLQLYGAPRRVLRWERGGRPGVKPRRAAAPAARSARLP